MLEESRGVALFRLGNLFGGTGGEDLASLATALWADVDDPVSKFDDIEVVLNDDNGVATINEFLEYVHQDADVLEVETCGGLVEDVERLPCIFLGQFGGQFDALTLTTRKGGGGLAEFDVTKPHVLNGLDLAENIGHVFEELHGLVDGHVEHIGYRLALETHFERLTIIALAMTLLAGHLDIGQEVHLDGLVAIAATGLTTSTLDIEGESPWLITSDLGLREVDKQRTDIGKDTRICSWIGARCAPNGRLIDIHHLIYIFQTLDALVRHGGLQ